MKRITTLISTFFALFCTLLSFRGSAANLYWVGGSGEWHNPLHWSVSSGGRGGAGIPASSDNAIFDQNSFTSSGETVIFSGTMECQDLTLNGVEHPVISGVYGSSLTITGSFFLASEIKWNYAGDIHFKSSRLDNKILTSGKLLTGGVYFEGNGTWNMLGSLLLSPASILTFSSGTLNTNGNSIQCGTFKIEGNGYKLLNADNSLIAIKQNFDDTGASNFNYHSAHSKIYLQHALPVNSFARRDGPFGHHPLTASLFPGSIFSVDSVIVNPTCNGADTGNSCNGSITITSINSSDGGPYSISWAGPKLGIDTVTIYSVTGLCPNTYSYTIYDSATGDVYGPVFINIVAPPPLTTNFIKKNEKCHGDCNAWILTRISGETPNYTYQWSNGTSGIAIGSPSNSFYDSNVCAGSNAIRIFDSHGCVNTFHTTITQPTQLSISFAPVNILCNGSCTGSVTATVTGGHGGVYTYFWEPGGQTTKTVTGLCAGTYTLVAKDDSGCVDSNNVVITQPLPLTISVSSTNPTCNGNCNGSATATVSGGKPAYTYSWNNGASTSSISSLCAGVYKIVVTDANGCKDSTNVTITGPTPISLSVSQTNITCNGNCNGSASVSASGGTPAYTYKWSTGATTTSISSLCPGAYKIVVTDSKGCKDSATVTITQPLALAISIASTNLTCNGTCNGSATATVSGGTPTYTYKWNTGATTSSISNLCAGAYKIVITDANGCKDSTNVTITQPPPIIITTTSTNVSCNGSCIGTATASASGGTSPYTYKWSTGATTTAISSLCSGVYKIVVTDAKGCKDSANVTITQPSPLTITTSQTNINCKGNCNGSATATVSGGTPAYTYKWNTGATTSSISSLCAGVYKIVVTDSKGCKDSVNVTITQPAIALTITTTQTNITCNGSCNGTATATASGGTPAYTYAWSNGKTTSSITGLCAGVYKIVVTDANGCKDSVNITITQPVALTISIAQTNINCNGNCNGTATATVGGGTLAYTYSWSTGATTSSISGLCAGVYKFLVTDSHGCKDSVNVTITQPAMPLSVSTSQTNLTCNGTCNGTATATASGGTPAYIYSWSNGKTTSSISGLCAGVYKIVVTDSKGCKDSATVTITQPTSLTITTTQTNLTCNGTCIGVATATVSGGTPVYTYKWSNGATTSSITGLCAGVYKIVATDANSCKDSVNVTITQPTALSLTTTQTNVSCNGNCNGKATVHVSGGTPVYTYLWNFGATTSSITGLCDGSYRVVVTDANGCKDSISLIISQPNNLVVTTSQTNISCKGDCNGNASVSMSGGIMPYTYSWSTGNTTSSISGLCPGTYYIVTHDSNGCRDSLTVIITEPAAALSLSITSTNLSCNGNCNGTATAIAAGGTTPYTYFWSTGTTSSSITGLCIGFYEVFLTDAHGCRDSASVIITQPPSLVITPTQTNASCNGNCDGTASASVSGGTSPYTYSWNTGATTSSISGLCAGTDMVVVTDSNGCKDSNTFFLSQPSILSIAPSQTNVSCNGNCNGTATASVSGGTLPYTYSWSNGASSITATGLCAGIYSITVTDANGCKDSTVITITQPTALSASASVSANVLCNGGATGVASVTDSGGTSPYFYSWSPSGGSGSSATGLTAGSYTVYITDANGCGDSASVLITQPPMLNLSASVVTNVLCNGSNTGSAVATASGGVSPYTYSWSPSGVSSSNASSLYAGTYTITVTDSNGCATTTSVVITEPNSLILLTTKTNATCYNSCNGTGTVMASGGTGPYTYSWSNGQTTSTATGLCAMTYSVTVTDSSGCSLATAINISEPAQLVTSITTNTIFCSNTCDGSAYLNTSGGTAPYTYTFNNGSGNNTYYTDTINNLCPGKTYTVTVTDSNGCTYMDSVNFTNPAGMNVTPSVSNSSCNNTNDGAIALTISGGVSPYTYSWSNSSTSQNQPGLLPGIYSVIITDSNGCTFYDTITVGANISVIANAAKDTAICANNPVLLSGAGSVNAASYAWYQLPSMAKISDTVIVTVSPSSTTTYIFVASNGACSDTAKVTVTINPPITVDAGPTQSIFSGNSTPIGGSPTGPSGSTYLWVPSSGLSDSTASNPVASPTTTTTYTVYVNNPNGCPASDTVTVFVVPLVNIPDGFTPNGDGQNDKWDIGFIDNYPAVLVEVYNRWGQELFRSVGYKTPWDGTYDGKPVPIGTYYYIINLNDSRFPKAYTGPVTILR